MEQEGDHRSCGQAATDAPSRIEQAFDLLPSAILVLGEDLGLVACNRAAQHLLGLDRSPAAGTDLQHALASSRHLHATDQHVLADAIRSLGAGDVSETRIEIGQRRVFQLTGGGSPGARIVSIITEAANPRPPSSSSELDDLTGLLNRNAFRECLSDAEIEMRMNGRPVALLFLDLDRFKQVNDTLGHPIGDILLTRVAERMSKALRSEDIIGRLGGDEFGVLTTNVAPESIQALSDRLIDLVSRPYLVGGHLISIGVSIGAALMPEDAESADQLATCADLALYRAKDEGRGVLKRYLPEMSEQAAARRILELDLRKAVLLGEFELSYQPQMAIDGNRVVGFEALLRWNHPKRGRVSPLEFISLAEETGQIVAIGEWVLRTAVREASTWPETVSIAVNLSPVQFRSSTLVSIVADVLAETGLAPHRLELEVTEGVLLADERHNIALLAELQALGVRIAIDDFGTGYASLAYLKRFSFNKIKIDQSFVREMIDNPDSDAIVEAIVSLGSRLGMTTIAEGVETVEELARIRAHGCVAVQGYLTGRPMNDLDVRQLLGLQPQPQAARA